MKSVKQMLMGHEIFLEIFDGSQNTSLYSHLVNVSYLEGLSTKCPNWKSTDLRKVRHVE